ncbi:hypothetical protein HDU67_009110, partial [Dinochytrium kinnereticum]
MTESGIASFVSKYVRRLAENEEKRQEVLYSLQKGLPFVENSFAAVVGRAWKSIIRVDYRCGLQLLKQVAPNITKIIDVVVRFKGDIVKFLGDAIIATFHPEPDSPTERNAVERATQCCLDIMINHPFETVDISALSFAINSSPSSKNEIASGNLSKKKAAVEVDLRLKLHMAITSGIVSNIIIGSMLSRMEYIVNGEIAIQADSWDNLLSSLNQQTRSIWKTLVSSTKEGVIIGSASIPTIYAKLSAVPESLPLPGNIEEEAKLSQNSLSVESNRICHSNIDKRRRSVLKSVTSRFLEKFVNASIAMIYSGQPSNRIVSIRRKIANETDLNSQYRSISVIFVKLQSDFDPNIAQSALLSFLESLKAFGGVFQQYVVDDKGQTMLACFGLPPWTHENEAHRALHCAISFRNSFTKCPITVAVTSGVLLVTRLGNNERSEVSLLGNVVNQAARFLGVAIHQYPIVCDAATVLATSGFKKGILGKYKLKGNNEMMEIWHVDGSEGDQSARQSSLKAEAFGYMEEKERIFQALSDWRKKGKTSTKILVEGPSGIGKSTLLDIFVSEVKRINVDFWY